MPKSFPPSAALPGELAKPEPILPLASALKQQAVKSDPLVTPEDFSWHCIRTLNMRLPHHLAETLLV